MEILEEYQDEAMSEQQFDGVYESYSAWAKDLIQQVQEFNSRMTRVEDYNRQLSTDQEETLVRNLDILHERGLVHLDIHPENILINGDQALFNDFDNSVPWRELDLKTIMLDCVRSVDLDDSSDVDAWNAQIDHHGEKFEKFIKFEIFDKRINISSNVQNCEFKFNNQYIS